MKKYIRATSSQDQKAENLRKKIEDKVIEVMQEPSMGFPEQEAREYSKVVLNEANSDYIEIEVRAEVSYEGLMKLSEALDPLVKRYNGAYFEAVCPGIISAYIEKDML